LNILELHVPMKPGSHARCGRIKGNGSGDREQGSFSMERWTTSNTMHCVIFSLWKKCWWYHDVNKIQQM